MTLLLLEPRAGYVYEKVPKSEVEELVLEEVPDIAYESIGGLGGQIEQIRDAVELPYLHPELFKEHELKPPKGVLLYGPPGCGKTLIAKAVANSLAKKVAAKTGQEGKSYFLNIKGPELLNKYVGETERHIRLVFQRAREKASGGTPVIVFFDEMDSLFRTRGSGVSSDVENTIVPQLLSEIDGVELLENVLVIGASNREDMIDPAILRPGRLDVKIKIERPDAEAARDIFSKYLTTSLPLHADDLGEFGNDRDACIGGMIQATVERMYTETEENRFLEVTYANGDKEVLYFKDFNSGAMIQNIVDRAKKMAIKDFLEHDQTRSPCLPPAPGVCGRVQGERGPPEHHEPRRLGAHLRQEGRADRLHPHPHHRQGRHRTGPVDRHGVQHRPVPLGHARGRIRAQRARGAARDASRARPAVRHRAGRRVRRPDRARGRGSGTPRQVQDLAWERQSQEGAGQAAACSRHRLGGGRHPDLGDHAGDPGRGGVHLALCVAWSGIVAVNFAHAFQGRRRRRP